MNQPKSDGLPLAPLASPWYLIAFMLAILPVFELGASVASFEPGDLRWRFGAVGLISGIIPGVSMGLFMAIAGAYFFRHPWTLRVLSVLTVLLALTLLALLGTFTLDALQVRNEVVPQAVKAFTTASIRAVLSIGVGTVVLAVLGFTGFRLASRQRLATRPSTSAQGSLVVGRAAAGS